MSEVSKVADAVELGVPFTDPMADGITIQDTSREALEQGVTLRWILEMLRETELHAPVLLMGYVNPFLAYGLERLGEDAAAAGRTAEVTPEQASGQRPGQVVAWIEGDARRTVADVADRRHHEVRHQGN